MRADPFAPSRRIQAQLGMHFALFSPVCRIQDRFPAGPASSRMRLTEAAVRLRCNETVNDPH
ncbi:MAG: hypothetical protein HIU85_02780 [Proteobacteria bacterium]|nr:hypothetical protein [Pseudomonadota bacterium]